MEGHGRADRPVGEQLGRPPSTGTWRSTWPTRTGTPVAAVAAIALPRRCRSTGLLHEHGVPARQAAIVSGAWSSSGVAITTPSVVASSSSNGRHGRDAGVGAASESGSNACT